MSGIQQRLAALRSRMDQMYEDKLDGKIDQEFWTRKMNEWREQERMLEAELSALSNPVTQDHVLTVKRIFELANRAHFSISYEEHSGTRRIAEISAFELLDRWRKLLPDLSEAL